MNAQSGISMKRIASMLLCYCLQLLTCLKKKTVILQKTCAQKLQTFHHPSIKYFGSPRKAGQIEKRKAAKSIDYESEDEDYKIWRKNRFRNLIVFYYEESAMS